MNQPLQLIFEVHLLKTSERTVAQEMFFTIRGIKALNSVLATSLDCKDIASWHDQWISFTAGWLSFKLAMRDIIGLLFHGAKILLFRKGKYILYALKLPDYELIVH